MVQLLMRAALAASSSLTGLLGIGWARRGTGVMACVRADWAEAGDAEGRQIAAKPQSARPRGADLPLGALNIGCVVGLRSNQAKRSLPLPLEGAWRIFVCRVFSRPSASARSSAPQRLRQHVHLM